jgi:UDP-N-acetylglucosamine 2-epimerase (non-hydrolysing)
VAHTILTLFGTRPEVIKLSPVIAALEARPGDFVSLTVASGQHTELLYPLARRLGVRIDHDLAAMRPRQSLSRLAARLLATLDPVLARRRPDALLVQGDTTTALAGALAAFHRGLPIGHVEAGLRTGDRTSPFPEEMNRRLITRLATWHFAATTRNRATLLAEGVEPARIFVTGNPVVDAIEAMLAAPASTPRLESLLAIAEGRRLIVVTTHRRERLGPIMAENLRALRDFAALHPEVAIVFPVHLNPAVGRAARAILEGQPGVHLVPPLPYDEFIPLLRRAWLLVSDSGGLQEEAPSVGVPLLVLRESTERPEAIDCGVARLVGGAPGQLARALEVAWRDDAWAAAARGIANPFGQGDAGPRIAQALHDALGAIAPARPARVGAR